MPLSVGVIVGLGLLCIAKGLVPQRRTLHAALASLSEPRWPTSVSATAPGLDTYAYRIGSWIMRLFGADMQSLQTDLLILDRSEEVHLMERIRTSVFFVGTPPVLVLLLPYVFGGQLLVAPMLVVALSVLLGLAGWSFTDAQVRHRASARRDEFDSSLVTYLGLVSILTAAGSGINEALWSAVDQGVGWPFQVLRRTLSDARNRGISPWDAMEEHAERLELDSMAELAATMKLGGTSGAFIRDSVMTKARSLRVHQLAEIEQEANSRTAAMVGPTGLMMAGFVILLLYPAVVAVLNL